MADFVKKILFYLQPQTIRNNPLAFEWIFLKYILLSNGFIKQNFQTAFLTDNSIKKKYINKNLNHFSPSDFGIAFCGTDWPAYWVDILTDEHIEEKDNLLNALYAVYKFDIVICWNYDATLNRFCKEKKIPTIYQELGLIRNPILYQMDFNGLLWKSSLPRAYKKFRDILSFNSLRLNTFLQAYKAQVRIKKSEIISKLDFASQKPILLIPLQVEDDSNIMVGSPFKKMADFVNFCLNRIKDIDRFSIIVKKHPVQPDVVFDAIPSVVILSTEIDNLSLINIADYIITINSSMGFEGLCFGKKVLTFGKSPYNGIGFTIDLDISSRCCLNDYDEFFKSLYTDKLNDLKQFLSFAIFNYHLTANDALNPSYYIDLFYSLYKAADIDRIYLERNTQKSSIASGGNHQIRKDDH